MNWIAGLRGTHPIVRPRQSYKRRPAERIRVPQRKQEGPWIRLSRSGGLVEALKELIRGG